MKSQREYDEIQRGSEIMDREHKPIIELEGEQQMTKDIDQQLTDIFGSDGDLSVQGVSDIIHRPTSTVYKLLQTGELPGYKMFGEWRVKKTDLLEWGRKQRKAS